MPGQHATARRPLARVAVLLALTCLGACHSAPYVDRRREAGKKIMVGSSNNDVIAICYKGGKPNAKVQELADSACKPTGRVAQYVSHTRFSCNWAEPSRAFFKCVASPKPDAVTTPNK